MSFRIIRVLIAAVPALAGMVPGISPAAGPSTVAQAEIAHLLSYLAASDCRFFRNGKWYEPQAAREHLQDKYDYLRRKALLGTAEDFIRFAATQSSVSGKPYRVKCGASEPRHSAAWLTEELSRHRASSAR